MKPPPVDRPPDSQDARRQSPEVQLERRTEAIRLHRQGVPVMQIVERTGLSWPTVNAAIKRWKAGGDAALEPTPRGRKLGTGRKLTEGQERQVRKLIRAKRPWTYGLDDGLWNTDAVRRLIQAKLAIQLTAHGTANYLKRWGVGAQNQKKSARDRCSGEVKAWLGQHAKILEQATRDEEVQVYWTNLVQRLDANLWGAPQHLRVTSDDFTAPSKPPVRTALVSVSTGGGKLLWLVMDGQFVRSQQLKFLRALVKYARRRPVCVVRNSMSSFADIAAQGDSLRVLPE